MNPVLLEAYLARLYSDQAERERFLADPVPVARAAGLRDADAESLGKIDKIGLRMAADSFAHKRAQYRRPKKKLHGFWFSWIRHPSRK